MEPNPPLTAKEAALQGAQADKPPFNPEADKQHIIASAIRLAADAAGQSKPAMDQIQPGPVPINDVGLQGMLGKPEDAAQTIADPATLADWPAAGDVSLANRIMADQAASNEFAATPGEVGASPPIDSSHDAWRSPSGTAAIFDTPAETSPQPSALPDLSQFNEGSSLFVNTPSNTPNATPGGSSGIENSQFDASGLTSDSASSLSPPLPPPVSDWFQRYEPPKPSDIRLLPYNPADEPGGPQIQWLASAAAAPEASAADEGRTPITYRPIDEPAPAPNGPSAPVEKLRIEFESNVAEVQRDSILTFTAMELDFIKLVEHIGEQDRRDAFVLAASRRACLGK